MERRKEVAEETDLFHAVIFCECENDLRRDEMGHFSEESVAERAARVKKLDDALIERVMKIAQGRVGQFSTAVPGLDISVRDERNASERCVYRRSLGVMLSGRKRSIVGNRVYEYGAGDMLYTIMDMPAMWQVVGATKEHPFIAVSVELDEEVLRELIPRVRLGSRCTNMQAIGLERSDPELLEVFLRLLQLLDRPDEIEVMAPMLLREIHFRALLGPQGPALAAAFTQDSQSNHIGQTIDWIKANVTASVSIEEMADRAHMAPSTFHRHFKAVTSLSPLQYHKRLKLHEAQRLMLVKNFDASQAAYAVGYASATQFSRDYKKLFGTPPKKSVRVMKNHVTPEGVPMS